MQTIACVLRTIIDQRSGVATPLSQIQVLDNWSSIFALPQEIACEGMPIDQGSAVIEGVCGLFYCLLSIGITTNVSGQESWVLKNT
jgi:hypothetical protein